ncbi:unnamed protein product [Pylaiella littoralis]
MFFTCCTLHNMLHAFDGLDEFEPTVEWGGRRVYTIPGTTRLCWMKAPQEALVHRSTMTTPTRSQYKSISRGTL